MDEKYQTRDGEPVFRWLFEGLKKRTGRHSKSVRGIFLGKNAEHAFERLRAVHIEVIKLSCDPRDAKNYQRQIEMVFLDEDAYQEELRQLTSQGKVVEVSPPKPS